MERAKIIRVWGTADNFDIEFSHNGGIEWICSVPPDTKDGIYTVELYAMNESFETCHWVGELFMCNGMCHLDIQPRRYTFWFKPVSKIEYSEAMSCMIIDTTVSKVKFIEATTNIIKERCVHR